MVTCMIMWNDMMIRKIRMYVTGQPGFCAQVEMY